MYSHTQFRNLNKIISRFCKEILHITTGVSLQYERPCLQLSDLCRHTEMVLLDHLTTLQMNEKSWQESKLVGFILMINKKVLLRDRKRRTTRGVSWTWCVRLVRGTLVLSGGGGGGCPVQVALTYNLSQTDWSKPPPPQLQA